MKSFLKRWRIWTLIMTATAFSQLALGTRFQFDEPLEVWIILILAPPVVGAILAAVSEWDARMKARKAAQ